MEMVRHHHHGNHLEGVLLFDVAGHFAQLVDITYQQILLSVSQVDGEEPACTACHGSAIARVLGFAALSANLRNASTTVQNPRYRPWITASNMLH
jgi:hypothetical protein